MKDLADRVAIVTGSSSGVGAATARLLASEGCHVLINYNSNEEGANAVAGSGSRNVVIGYQAMGDGGGAHGPMGPWSKRGSLRWLC